MILANANSNALLQADPYIELFLAILCFLGCGLIYLNFHLEHRKLGARWTRREILICLGTLGFGLMFVAFHFGPHD